MSTEMSQCIFRRDRLVSRCVVMEDRKAVFVRFSPLKDLSAEQLVTGRVHKMVTNTLMLGYMEVACLRVVVGLDGKLQCPCSVRCWCHFNFEQSNSLWKHC